MRTSPPASSSRLSLLPLRLPRAWRRTPSASFEFSRRSRLQRSAPCCDRGRRRRPGRRPRSRPSSARAPPARWGCSSPCSWTASSARGTPVRRNSHFECRSQNANWIVTNHTDNISQLQGTLRCIWLRLHMSRQFQSSIRGSTNNKT